MSIPGTQTPRARRSCDIVMKGGITSGVVYPKAIVRLAARFTLKNIGGTSAGAIAAAAAAAAEFRRTRSGSDAGFELLGTLGDFLAEKPPGAAGTRLFSLFRPDGDTRRVFTVLTGALNRGRYAWVGILNNALQQYYGAALMGALPGLLFTLFSLVAYDAGGFAVISAVIGVLIGLVGAVVAVVVSLIREFLRVLPHNNFGLCSGMSDDIKQKLPAEPLTMWLAQYLSEVAGFAPGHRPLTFGDLWNPKNNPDIGDVREVNLEMMTTNLTHGRPYRLPFRDDDDLHENHLFFFNEDEFRRLFTEEVVQWMINHPRPLPSTPSKLEEEIEFRIALKSERLHCMPAPADLPVVVATRMSLSFPFLLSAIPLYAIDRSKDRDRQRPERCWFTDGGLCSNLPLHFFDSPLPRRPTFNIDLTEKPDDTSDADLAPAMDDENGTEPIDRWNRFDLIVAADPAAAPREKTDFGKFLGFVSTMISTMQNWNDATTSRLPGYRDRIVRIPLTSRQGGLNLNMPPDLVKFLSDQGSRSAEVLIQHFDVPAMHPRMTWENHRWIRIRAMLAAFEKMVDHTLTTCEQPENGDVSYEEWLKELHTDKSGDYKKLSYRPTKDQINTALATIQHLRTIRALWTEAGTAAAGAPKPRPILRPRPQV